MGESTLPSKVLITANFVCIAYLSQGYPLLHKWLS